MKLQTLYKNEDYNIKQWNSQIYMKKLDKIAIILPKEVPFRYEQNKINTYPLSTVPLTIPVLVSLIPKELNIQVEVYDESIEEIEKEAINVDLIAISAITPTINRAYAYADYFRSKNVPVVIGGIHATLNPQEVLQHADSVVCGLANETWPQLLRDFNDNKLQKVYNQGNIDFCNMPLPDRNCYKNKTTSPMRLNSIQATYGCDNACEFCVQPYVCKGYHQRPIEQIVEEIKTINSKFIEFYDPNLPNDHEYLTKLCKALIPLKKIWSVPATIDLAEDKELLKLLYKSGCRNVLIGFESINSESIKNISKQFNKVEQYQKAINNFHKAGITIAGSFVLGLDSDTKDIFQQTLDFVNKTNIDLPRFTINTPFPGTPFYEQMKKGNRIIENDWSKYDLHHVVIKPKNMSVEELQKGFNWISKEAYKPITILKRVKFLNSFSLLMFFANISLKIKCQKCLG